MHPHPTPSRGELAMQTKDPETEDQETEDQETEDQEMEEHEAIQLMA
jgi:hypothetical protein